ncbi:MAG: hypothetical protein FGM22_07250 [Burkholderiaceae bacterium]|nr:hypothetical protein [Burkholderiaceae bacterium]
MKSKFDCWYTDEPVCPHCGEEVRDSWELFIPHQPNDTVDGHECEHCGKQFDIMRAISFSYTTLVAAEGKDS